MHKRQDHLLKDSEPSPTEGWPTREKHTSWCGDVSFTMVGVTRQPHLMGCKKCAQAYWAHELAQVGHKLELVKVEEPHALRSLYRATMDGEHLAFVGIDTGWGQGWQIFPLARTIRHGTADNEIPPVARSPSPVRKSVSCKEEALSRIPLLRTEGHLPSAKALEIAAREEWVTIMQRRDNARRQQIMLSERNALINDAVVSLLARADLTNVERAGLVALCEDSHTPMTPATEGEDA